MRGDDRCTPAVQHADDAIEAIRDGLIRYFVEEDTHVRIDDLRDLRCRIADRIEADIALLDALDADPEFELEDLDASATEWTGRGAHRFNVGRAA